NWAWDSAANAYYWHRFFSHQPDLNYDNPEVRDAMLQVLRFWLDLGIDGFRLDAVPYLFERERTNCENLAETHEYLRRIRGEIDVMHAILFSLPGSPVLYYGDEIGMGDNIYLGDRDGVRTPMQWTGDRNGGFSRADFAQLYLPPSLDPVYGYPAVNVEAQLRTPTSFLRWLHRFIDLRKQHPVFGLGSYEPLEPANPRV